MSRADKGETRQQAFQQTQNTNFNISWATILVVLMLCLITKYQNLLSIIYYLSFILYALLCPHRFFFLLYLKLLHPHFSLHWYLKGLHIAKMKLYILSSAKTKLIHPILVSCAAPFSSKLQKKKHWSSGGFTGPVRVTVCIV